MLILNTEDHELGGIYGLYLRPHHLNGCTYDPWAVMVNANSTHWFAYTRHMAHDGVWYRFDDLSSQLEVARQDPTYFRIRADHSPALVFYRRR